MVEVRREDTTGHNDIFWKNKVDDHSEDVSRMLRVTRGHWASSYGKNKQGIGIHGRKLLWDPRPTVAVKYICISEHVMHSIYFEIVMVNNVEYLQMAVFTRINQAIQLPTTSIYL